MKTFPDLTEWYKQEIENVEAQGKKSDEFWKKLLKGEGKGEGKMIKFNRVLKISRKE